MSDENADEQLRGYRAEYAAYLDDPAMVARLLFDRAVDGDRAAVNFIVNVVADTLAPTKRAGGS
jgi:hypothetical protein